MERAGRDTTATKRTKRLLNNVLGLWAMRIATVRLLTACQTAEVSHVQLVG